MNGVLHALLDERGQGATEYAILLGAISLSSVLTLSAIGTRLQGVFANVTRELDKLPILG